MTNRIYEDIKKTIDGKGTYPRVATLTELRWLKEKYSRDELNKAVVELTKAGKLKVRDGINQKMIEIYE